MSKTAITPTRAENFSEWYQNLIAAADLAESSPSAGNMTVKPYGWAIWELMRDELDKRIKVAGVQNVQFPTLIPLEYFNKEAQHIEGFAKESMIVTHHRLKMIDGALQPDPESKLTEPYVMRPTSETIIGEAMSRWIQSYRDLPMKLNQWTSVFRWEMRPRIFLRTREFFWQEGHNVFSTAEQAHEDAIKMHHLYSDYMSDVLAIDSINGEKTAEERFAGADHTYTREHIMQDGKALQVGTSHDLGQHFSKSFGIKFLGPDGKQEYAYTTSWGTTSRMIGSVIMIHGDDDGLVLPPVIAPYQVVVIPIVRDDNGDALNTYAQTLGEQLTNVGVRVMVDTSDARSADKMWKWIKHGVPLRIEIGAREMENNQVTITRRDLGKDSKVTLTVSDAVATISDILKQIQADMLEACKKHNQNMTHNVSDLVDLEKNLEQGKIGFFRLRYELTQNEKFDELMEKYKISRRCLDDNDPAFVFVAKSY
ncbi:MAG: proline--tRNA ligase [Rickettsiales bacterium]|jgi:prolyl-tRNA synthetase|nr:proline--tRNA ligase [Rickettsiales bacterium]